MFSSSLIRKTSLAALLPLAAFVLAGCGGGPDMAPAGGTVLYNGEPLADADVLFMPEGGGPVSVGKTDSEGKFTLSATAKPGARVGKHKVSVQSIEAYLLANAPKEEESPENEGGMRYGRRWLIPEKYGNYISSGLEAEVVAGGENNFTFELTGEAPNKKRR